MHVVNIFDPIQVRKIYIFLKILDDLLQCKITPNCLKH